MDSSDRPGDEPAPCGEEWVEYGGELVWAVDFTPGGAPIGLTSKEFRQLNAQHEPRADWARAKALLAWAFEACSSPGADVEVGRVRKIGNGLSRMVYAAHVELSPDPDHLSGAWAVLLPDPQATPEDCQRWVREIAVLGQLARKQLPFRVPAPLGAFPEGNRPAIIRRFADGIPVDLRAGRMQSVRPAELVGRIAAAIHAIDVTDWPHRPPGGATRRAHAEEVLRVFDDLGGTETQSARGWAVQHLPPDRPAAVLHGDLLGQNILVFPEVAPTVIDWEFCRMGDPAFDLAIVTRGVRRPFQMAGGLDRLLDAYATAGGDPITRAEVHFHELCLAARWYREALQGSGSEPPEQALARLRGILRRTEESTRRERCCASHMSRRLPGSHLDGARALGVCSGGIGRSVIDEHGSDPTTVDGNCRHNRRMPGGDGMRPRTIRTPPARRKRSARRKRREVKIKLPPAADWRTTDQDEINRRRLRALEEQPRITNLDPRHPIFSNFEVRSRSGMTYNVEVRDIAQRQFHSTTVDFQINGLGTCKHTEAVLLHLESRFPRKYASGRRHGSDRIDIVPDVAAGTLKVERNRTRLSPGLRRLFDADGYLRDGTPEEAIGRLRTSKSHTVRISQEVDPWLRARRQANERRLLRREYERRVQAGILPQHETKLPLYPYQREGMLHLAFSERALLADEMGLGKTIQAIAACSLLHRLGQARRALIVSPASLKSEWEEQIQKFTDLPYQVVYGLRHRRLVAYGNAPFFTIVNYEQMVRDALEVNVQLAPDVVILDEAQRIKNWSTKTAQAVKRLQSRYAFVLTGTPIENRIDEIYSIVNFVDPLALGPLFRFNREFYELDDRGRPQDYKNLDKLRERIRPHVIRRRKADVETELPSRTDRNHFVRMSPLQRGTYHEHEAVVARLLSVAKHRPLTNQEQDKLMRELAMMRMICDTNYILDPEDRTCPKLKELASILDGLCADPDVKIVVFSEWVRMLDLVRGLLDNLGLGYALHTGKVPQRRRRAEIYRFKTDPRCRIFLSTDSGGVGLNLQAASVVVNCDLPWNPAKLEQRIARVWRKHQMRNVTVLNLVSEDSIEQRMLETLAAKRSLADGVLDGVGELGNIPLKRGAQAFLDRLKQVVETTIPRKITGRPQIEVLPVDRSAGFAARVSELLGGQLVTCEERYPEEGAHSVMLVVVDREAGPWMERIETVHAEFFGKDKIDPLSPVQLQVIDRTTFAALEQLSLAGLLKTTLRATRHLHPAPEAKPTALPPSRLPSQPSRRRSSRAPFANPRASVSC